jgi:hypothetical protein
VARPPLVHHATRRHDARANHPIVAIEEHYLDREAHADRVDGMRSFEQHPVPWGDPVAS